MSKPFQRQKLLSKPYNEATNNLNKSVQELLNLYSNQNKMYLKNISTNKNNISVDSPKHFSPTYRTPISLPSLK